MSAEDKLPLSEAECLRPSSFASRKADAERRNATQDARQMVSMGKTEHWMRDRKGKDVYVPAELFFERGHPMRRYVRLDGDTHFHALFDDHTRPEKPEQIGEISRVRFAGAFPPAGPETREWA